MIFTCKTCNKSFEGKQRGHKYIYCSRKCQIPSQKGKHTRRFDKIKRKGYWFIYLPDNPMAGKQGYVAEHRLVMSKKIGRPIDSKEIVHHINHIKTDNRIENLMLFSSISEHFKNGHPEFVEKLSKTKFVVGHSPWNKGTKGVSKPNSGSFKKGQPSNKKTGKFIDCIVCGKKFWTVPSTKRKFCSHSCYWNSKKNHPIPWIS